MLQGLYSSTTGMNSALEKFKAISHNLAHVNMPGHKRLSGSTQSFEDIFDQPELDIPAFHGAEVTGPTVDFNQGALTHTGNTLDVAIRGNGFFVLDGPDGPLYTRNGTFALNGAGELVSQIGLPVQGGGGPIVIPPGTASIVIGEDGSVRADNQEVGQIQLTAFQDLSALELVGTTLFAASNGAATTPSDGTIHSGYRENSNANVVEELVQLIAAQRHFEASQRAFKSIDQAIEMNTSPQGN